MKMAAWVVSVPVGFECLVSETAFVIWLNEVIEVIEMIEKRVDDDDCTSEAQGFSTSTVQKIKQICVFVSRDLREIDVSFAISASHSRYGGPSDNTLFIRRSTEILKMISTDTTQCRGGNTERVTCAQSSEPERITSCQAIGVATGI